MDTLTTRNATLQDLAALLKLQQAAKLDVVLPATAIRCEHGLLRIDSTDVQITDEGVTPVAGLFRPTELFDGDLAEKLKIPRDYLRRLRSDRPDLFDANVNGWLHGTPGEMPSTEAWTNDHYAAPDDRRFLVRCFRADGEGPGVARALLSDSFKMIENFDVLIAALEGVKMAGVKIAVQGCDLSERRMRVRIVAPEITALAPVLLAGYRSPFVGETRRVADNGWSIDDSGNPVVFAGLELGNSETGGGAFSIVPRFLIPICMNGQVIDKLRIRSVHLGGKLEEGVVKWSAATEGKQLELITAKTRDAVQQFLSPDFLAEQIALIEQKAGTPLANPAEDVRIVTARLKVSDELAASILDHFIRGAQTTAGGVAHAFTSVAQTVANPDMAAVLEEQALQAMELAASLA